MNLGVDLTPLWLTLKVAGVATLVAFGIGVSLAFLVARSQFWGREVAGRLLHPAPGAASHGLGVLPHRADGGGRAGWGTGSRRSGELP